MKSKKKTVVAKRGFGIFDWDGSRKNAIQAVKSLRKVVKDAEADLSVHERFPRRLKYVLGLVEETLNEMLPPDGLQNRDLFKDVFEYEDSNPTSQGVDLTR